MIVSFEGGIGSGKSSVMEKVKQYFEENNDKTKSVITEDVDVWKNEGWLDLYYKDRQRYALGFQLRVLMSQYAMYSKMNINNINIVERCPLTNDHVFGKMLLNDGAIHPLEYDLCSMIRTTFTWKPDRVIYLKASAETCMHRILRRSRDGEGSITMSYLKNMNTAYDDYIFNVLPKVYGISPIIINAENDIDTVCQDIINVLP
jgi:deoxyadenosine/deoxycytidine kinase